MNSWTLLTARGGKANFGMTLVSLVMVLNVLDGLMTEEAGAAGGVRGC